MNCIHRRPSRIPFHSCSIRRRGTALIVVLILIPISLSLYFTAFSRIDIANMQTRRDAARTQARLLAESALAAYQAALDDAPAGTFPRLPISGALEGIGAYRVVAIEGNKANVESASGAAPLSASSIRAIGEAEYLKDAENSAKVVCEIEAGVFSADAITSAPRPSVTAFTISYRAAVLKR